MNALELRWGRTDTLVVHDALGSFDPPPPAQVEARLSRVEDEVVLSANGHAWPVRGASRRDDARLRNGALADAACVVWIARSSTAAVTLHLRTFHGASRAGDALPIRLDEAVQEEARRKFGLGGTVAEIARRFEEWFVLPARPGDPPSHRRAVMIARREARSFRILGARASADIVATDAGPRVERVVRGNNDPAGAAQLLVADFSFVDASIAGALAASTRAELESAVRSFGSYLAIWDRYSDIDERQLHERAASFGHLPYRGAKRVRGGWRVTLAEGYAPVVGDTTDLCVALSAERLDDPSDDETCAPRRGPPPVVLRYIDWHGSELVLAPLDRDRDEAPPEQGWISLSVRGDERRIERRQTAQARILRGEVPMGNRLGLILEGRPTSTIDYKRHEPLSAAARAALGGRPTPKQREAVEVALNTPDIAIIQGPPGTGKTAVITAIQQRVAELDHGEVPVEHRILVTSAQHDAVENVVARTRVYDLPGVKIGQRRNGNAPTLSQSELFSREHAERIRATLANVVDAENIRHARETAVALVALPGTSAQVVASLGALRAKVDGLVPASMLDAIDDRARALSRRRDVDDDDWRRRRRAAEGIRDNAASFGDDGPQMAARALVRLESDLLPAERDLLQQCAALDAETTPHWLDAVAAARAAILDRLLAPAPQETGGLDAETRSLVVRVIDALRDGLATRRTREESVLASFLHDLETDPDGVDDTLRMYTAVLGSTLQQSAGREMARTRGLSEGHPEFDTVIIDEAARAHPLDLFIPMSMARRRIVLVGDHRQLPHMLEPQVEREIVAGLDAGDLSAQTERALKDSLFQRLWGLVKQLEGRDGRRRTVTLDTQFRMHPVLGDFVSRVFYETGDEDQVTIASPRPGDDFVHGIRRFTRGSERVAAWIDVPHERERRDGSSIFRPAEAARVAALAKELLDGDTTLSIGVIAFYSAQVRAIQDELRRAGVMERDEDEWRIADRYATGRDRRGAEMERFRVGTVDAFQGREFDVAILSLTRSNRLSDDGPDARRKKYGHLLLPNRLCVGMSRQKRLLITVGDLEFARRAEALPAVRALIELCEGEHGLIER